MSETFAGEPLDPHAMEAENARLRAELAAERERAYHAECEAEHYATLAFVDLGENLPVAWFDVATKLREVLELSRPYVGQADGLLADRIDAVLSETKGDGE